MNGINGHHGGMKLKINEFNESLNIGNIGEEFTVKNFLTIFKPLLVNYLYSNRYKYELNELIQKAGKDGKTGISLFEWDVKTRTKFYPDILLETYHSYGKLGWFFTSEADIIAYLYLKQDGTIDKGFLLIMKKLKDFFTSERLDKYPKIKAWSRNVNNQWFTLNVAVPFKDFPEKSLIYLPNLAYLKGTKGNQKKINQFIKNDEMEEIKLE